jgi:hypothetical protein
MYGELTRRRFAPILARGGDDMMTSKDLDAFFDSAAGPDVCGTRHVGRERVREAFSRIFTSFPDVSFGETEARRSTAERSRSIATKSSYLKNRTAQA